VVKLHLWEWLKK